MYFQAVRPKFILHALQWLKTNNALYSDIQIDIDNIDTSMTTLHNANKPEDEVLTMLILTKKTVRMFLQKMIMKKPKTY